MQKKTEVSTQEWIRRIKSTRVWQERQWFTANEMAKWVNTNSPNNVGDRLRAMYKDGLIERREEVQHNQIVVYWQAPATKLLRRSWRSNSNSEIGITKSWQFGVTL